MGWRVSPQPSRLALPVQTSHMKRVRPFIFLAPILAALSPMAKPIGALDACNGCQKSAGAEKSNSVDCSGCTLFIWTETSQFEENCGDPDIACNAAECSYVWKLKYYTSAATGSECDGQTWSLSSDPNQDPLSLPAHSNDNGRTIATLNVDGLCGLVSPFSYTVTPDSCTTLAITLAGTNGCGACSSIGGGN